MRIIIPLPGILLAGALGLASCVASPQLAYNSHPPPPPPVAETIPKPPVTEEVLVWQPGHWDWNGAGYLWVQGRFVPQAGHGNLWMPGFWQRSGGTEVWLPAHWM